MMEFERKCNKFKHSLKLKVMEEVLDDTSISRIRYLLKLHTEYLERLMGFAKMDGVTVKSLIEGDLYAAVFAANHVIEKEIGDNFDPELKFRWYSLKGVVEMIEQVDSDTIANLELEIKARHDSLAEYIRCKHFF